MCGICGFFDLRKVDQRQITDMCSSLGHRGPDDRGGKLFSTPHGSIGLGHRRLSIIDPSSSGHQPMGGTDNRVWIVYNGEVYNFLELKRQLVEYGYAFRGDSDTEVILKSYQEWGLEFLHKLSGMFALAIYDQNDDRIIVARDRMGIKPIYYYRNTNALVFASELKAILQYKGFDKEIDRESIFQYLSFQYIPSPRSIYQNTFKLEPGHFLILDLKSNQMRVERYWNLLENQGPEKENQNHGVGEYTEQLEELLKRSVEGHLISDVPVGAFLSGGIDSSLIVAIMSEISPDPVKTFTIGFREKHRNEAPYAKKIAEYLGTNHYEYILDPEDVFEVIPELVDYHDEPFGDSSSIPSFLLSEFATQEVKVVLSGDGGDELFGGYTRYVRVARAALIDSLLPDPLRKGIFNGLDWIPIDYFQRIAKGMQFDELIELFHFLLAMWKGDDHSQLVGQEYDFKETNFYQIWHKTSGQPLLHRLMQIDMQTYLPDDGLTKVDRASMANSLEVRVPLLDHHIVEFSLNLPLQYKAGIQKQKYLLKRILGTYLPQELYSRPKMGFIAPLNDWLRDELYYLVEKYLNKERIRQRGLLNPDYLDQIVQKHMSGRYNYFYMLWTVIMLEMWFERWID